MSREMSHHQAGMPAKRRALRKSPSTGPAFRERRIFLERLEERSLLNADWQNPNNPPDVDDDGVLAAIDVLLIINRINANKTGSALLTESRALGQPYYDVDGDNSVTASDVIT